MAIHEPCRSTLLSKVFILLIVLIISGCGDLKTPLPENKEIFVPTVLTSSTPSEIKPQVIPSLTPIKTNTTVAIISATPTFDQPSGCLQPIESYELIEINGMQINRRTYEMLLNAQTLYGGEIELAGYHLTQGSYNNTVSASFGTHDGGGAVDFSVFRNGTYQVLYEDINPLILALRTAGFAAWLRDFDQLYPGSPIHIHAIAIGDRDLSKAAEAQLVAYYAYFNGNNGIPPENGAAPIPDEYGGPIICEWMISNEFNMLEDAQP
jgi:hypothetical protein